LIGSPTVTQSPVANAASVCTGWSSSRVPPPTIRVLRTSGASNGFVQSVDFQTYVKAVLDVEWGTTQTAAWLQTGAIAVKQYGWYYTMHYRGGTAHGACYDVVDNTNDQIYRDTQTTTAAERAAVDATWGTSVTKNGAFLLTGYRSGPSLACGADYDGYHIYQGSARNCVGLGMSAEQVLHVYFDPGVAIWKPAPIPSLIFFAPADQAQVTVGATAALTWQEQPAAGTTVTSRHESLVMAIPRNGGCAVDRWMTVSASGWQSTGASPQAISGLRTGYCYRAVVTLTDSTAVTTQWLSGTMLVDPAAPLATFTSPTANVVTALSGTTATVQWTETVAAGTHVVSRILYTDRAAQAAAGTCMGGQWGGWTSTTAASPVASTGLAKLYCYRYRLVLTDSAGHKGTTVSAVLMGLPS
jgi:hypothetical protein